MLVTGVSYWNIGEKNTALWGAGELWLEERRNKMLYTSWTSSSDICPLLSNKY